MVEDPSELPLAGMVLGIDVGWNPRRPTTSLSVIEWTDHRIGHTSCLVEFDEINRQSRLRQIVGDKMILAVAIDGPLGPGLCKIHDYRTVEALLSRGKFQRRGKPGPTNGGSGPRLHEEAMTLARLVLTVCDVNFAAYPYAIHEKAVVEAFPNAFLAVLQSDKDFPSPEEVHRRWTDFLFPRTIQAIRQMMNVLLPDHELDFDIKDITGHEQVASVLCALTAFCVAAGRCVVVGAANSGYIVLPPLLFWGDSTHKGSRWAEEELRNNANSLPGAMLFSDNHLWTP
jgi:predicted RNase H-like nuclease